MSNKTIDEILDQLQYGTIMSDNQAMLTNNRNIATKAITQAMLDALPEKKKIPQLTKNTTVQEQRDFGYNQAISEMHRNLQQNNNSKGEK